MGGKTVRRLVAMCVVGAVLASACGGESADRDRNVDATPTDATPATVTSSGPKYRDLTFTETFTGTTMRAAETTADWGGQPGRLTMAAASAAREIGFTEQKLTYDPKQQFSDVNAADYGGPSEFMTWAGLNSAAFFRSAVGTSGGQKKAILAVGDASKPFMATQDDGTLVDLTGDGVEELIVAGSITPGQGRISVQNMGATLVSFDTFDDSSVAERVVVGDFSRDGLLDIVTVGKRVTLHRQRRPESGNLSFERATTVDLLGVSELSSPIENVAVGDVNNDGFDDLVLSGPGNLAGKKGLIYLYSSATEADSFTTDGVDLPTDVGSIGQVQVANLDGLPGNEILLNTSMRGLLYLPSTDVRRNGAGIQIVYPSVYAWYGAAGDVTGDGVTDLAFVDKVGRVYLRVGTRGSGWWRGGGTIVVSPEIVNPNRRSVRVRDVNGDGQNDISVVERFAVRNFIVGGPKKVSARITDSTFSVDGEEFVDSATIELGDLNRDGRQDVVVCGTVPSGQCHISLHSGSLISPYEQSAPVVVSVPGTTISDVAIGDLSGDGYPELVAVGDKAIRIFNNTRDPVKPFLNTIPAGDSVSRTIQLSTDPAVSVAIADITEGPDNDLIVGRTTKIDVRIGLGSQINTKTSTLTGVTDWVGYSIYRASLARTFTDVQLAKLNSDGRVDLVMIESGVVRTAISPVIGPGPTQPTEQTDTISIGENRSGRRLEPLIADFDGDGLIDIVAVKDGYSSSYPPEVVAAKGKAPSISSGDGYFSQLSTAIVKMPFGTQAILGSRIIDLNADSKPDLAVPVARSLGFEIYGLINTSTSGTVSFGAPSLIAMVPTGDVDVLSLHTGQFNSDSIPDVLRIDERTYGFLLSTPTSRAIGYAANDVSVNLGGRQIDRLEVANINGDDRPDLVGSATRSIKPGLSTAAFIGDGSAGGFASSAEIVGTDDFQVTAMAAGALGRDMLDDVAFSTRFGLQNFQNTLNVPDGQRRFSVDPQVKYSPKTEILDASIGRIDGDAQGDVAIGTLANRGQSFVSKVDQESFAWARPAERIRVADVNNDGLGEIIFIEKGALKVRKYVAPTLTVPPTFSPVLIGEATITTIGTETNVPSTGLLIDDIDGDGVLDALVATGRQTTAFVRGPLATTRDVDDTARISENDFSRMKLMDLNGDGLKDLVANRPTDTAPVVYLNNGSSSMPFKDPLTPAPVFAKDAAAGFATLDMNRDGLDDIVVANSAMGQSDVGKMKSYTARIIPGYANVNGVAVSNPLSSDAFIEKATLTPTATVPVGTAVTYEMTNNGTNWYEVAPGTEFVFPSNGKALSWRVKMASTDGAVTPVITKIVVAARAYELPVAALTALSLPGNGFLGISWTPGVVSSGGVVKQYKVINEANGDVLCVTSGTTCVVSGLTNLTQYRLKLNAENPAGVASTQITGDLTPTPQPERLDKPTVKAVNGGIEVSWAAKFNAATHLPVLDYTARAAGTNKTCTTTALSCTIQGLTVGQQYWVDVWARNAGGQGVASPFSDVVQPIGVPTIDASVSSGVALAQRTDGTVGVQVKSNLFFDGGSPIKKVTLWVDGEAVCVSDKSIDKQRCGDSVSTTSFVMSRPSLTADSEFKVGTEYAVSVSAENEAGQSVQTTPVKLTYLTPVPIEPEVRTTSGDGKVTFTWDVPPGVGPNYDVRVFEPIAMFSLGTKRCSARAPQNSCEITGLTNGESYQFNSNAGNGIWNSSVTIHTVTPYAVPGAPTSVSAYSAGGTVEVSWAGPNNESTAGPLTYDVVMQPGNKKCTVSYPAKSCSIAGFSRGDVVKVSIAAVGASGKGPVVEKSLTVSDKPGVVGNVMWEPKTSSVVLEWDPPLDNGGSPIVAYQVALDDVVVADVTEPRATIEGLTTGQSYVAKISARNEFGPVGDGVSVTVVPMDKPSPPTITGVQQTGSSIVFNVTAPSSAGGGTLITYDCVIARGSNPVETIRNCGVPGGDIVVDRGTLERGETLSLQVSAWNEWRESGLSPAFTVVIADVPNRISSVAGTKIDDDTWVFEITPPDDGGSPITDYRAEVREDGVLNPLMIVTADAKNPRLTVDFPVGKRASVALIAVNSIGASQPYVPFSHITVFTDPSSPEITGVTAGDGEVVVEWAAPDFDGGAPISGYSIEAVAEGSNELPVTVEAESFERGAVVRGLTNGAKYTIIVTAYSMGGLASAESEPVTPFGPPESPVVFLEAVGDGWVDVRLENPANTGGLPVESYTVTTIPEGGTCTVVNQRCRVTGLTNGVGYVVAATLTTAGDTSSESLSWSFTPLSFMVPPFDVDDMTPSKQPPRVIDLLPLVAADGAQNIAAPSTGSESSTTSPSQGASTTTPPSAGTSTPSTTVAPTTLPTPTGSSPTVTVGQKVALRALLSTFKVNVPKGATVSLDTKTSGTACTVTRKSVTGAAAGTCRVGVVVTPKKGKAKTVFVTIQVVAAKK
jgi:hypothetical protein